MWRSLFHSLWKEDQFDDTLGDAYKRYLARAKIHLSIRETKRKRGRRKGIEIARATSVKYTQRYSPRAFLNEPVAFLPIDWSARIALFKPRRIHYPATRFSFHQRLDRRTEIPRNSASMLFGYSRRSFPGCVRPRNLKFSRVGLEREPVSLERWRIFLRSGEIVSFRGARVETRVPRKIRNLETSLGVLEKKEGKWSLRGFIVVLHGCSKVLLKSFSSKKKKNEKKKESWNLFLGQIRTTFARCRTVCRSNAFLLGIQDNLSGLFQ